jgi:hypothetical protein
MNKKDDEITDPGMLSKPEKHLILAQFTNSPWTSGGWCDGAKEPRKTSAGEESWSHEPCALVDGWLRVINNNDTT